MQPSIDSSVFSPANQKKDTFGRDIELPLWGRSIYIRYDEEQYANELDQFWRSETLRKALLGSKTDQQAYISQDVKWDMDDFLYRSKLIGNRLHSLLSPKKRISSDTLKSLVYSREDIMSLSWDCAFYLYIRQILRFHPEQSNLLRYDKNDYVSNGLLVKRGRAITSLVSCGIATGGAAPLYSDLNFRSPTVTQNELRLGKCSTENRLESAQHKALMLRSHFPLPFIPGTRSQNCIPSDTQLVSRCSVSSSPQVTTIVDQMSSFTNNADVMSNSSLEHEISNDLGTRSITSVSNELVESVNNDTGTIDQDLINLINQLCQDRGKDVIFPSSDIGNTGNYRELAKEKMREHAPNALLSRFSGTGSSFLLSALPIAERRLVDLNSNIFEVQTEFPGMESVILKCETTAELIESNILKGNLRSVVETDLLWMTKALSVTPKKQEGYRVCSVLTFIPPRCFLFSDSEGNMSAARWSAIAELLETHYAAHPSVPGDIEIQPGVECAARNECGEYIRVIIIGQGTSSTSFRCAALDYHAMVEIEYSWFMALPRSLSTSFLPANTFLGRIRGIQYVPLEYQSCVGDILNQPFNEQETMPSSCAIFGIDPVDDICVVDVVSVNQNDWWSHVLVQDGLALILPSDPLPPSANEAYAVCEEIVTTHSNIEWDGNLGLIMDTQTKENNDRPEPSCQAETIESEVELEVEVEVQSGLGADSFNNEETEAERTMNSNLCHEVFNIECPIVTPTEMTNMAVQMTEFVDQGTVTENQSDAVVASLDLLSRFISCLPRSASTNSAIIKLIIGLLEVLAVSFAGSTEIETDLDEYRRHLNSFL